jgi:hypothetical protein
MRIHSKSAFRTVNGQRRSVFSHSQLFMSSRIAILKRRDALSPFSENPPLGLPQSSPLRHRVLLVDEDEEDLRHFTSLLDGMGYSVQASADHRQAEACLEGGYFDLVIMCQGSPVLETHRLARLTIGRNRFTPVVVPLWCYPGFRRLNATLRSFNTAHPTISKSRCLLRHSKSWWERIASHSRVRYLRSKRESAEVFGSGSNSSAVRSHWPPMNGPTSSIGRAAEESKLRSPLRYPAEPLRHARR